MSDRTSSPTPLELELVALGRALVVDPPPDDLAELVLARITDPAPVSAPVAAPVSAPEPGSLAMPASPGPTWLGVRRRMVAVAAAVAAVLVVALVPPVRAAVLDLLRIGGVSVREVPRPSPGASSSVSRPVAPKASPGAGALGSVGEASERVGFDVEVPSVLGPPSAVVLARDGRVVELTWGSGPGSTRLDAFDGTLSFGYLKSVWEAVTATDVDGQEAVWFAVPHLIEWTDRSGATVGSEPRVAGPTLVWVERDVAGGEVTYRLEGPVTLAEAHRVAESAG